jgi:hypothetical protein
MNHYHDLADRCKDHVYKQHLRNYANAIDATKCAADMYCNLAPEQFDSIVEYQDKVNEAFGYLVEMEREQIEMCTALNLYKNKELLERISHEA